MIYIDTGAFLARHLPADQHHKAALSIWEKLERARERCATSNFVLNETFTLLARRSSYPFAVERARHWLLSPDLTILRPGHAEELEAVAWFAKYADQEVPYTDCVSFALMRKGGLLRAFTFDAHFERAGFRRWP